MDPQTEGIMLSYATNVFIDEIDTTQLYDPVPEEAGTMSCAWAGDDNDPISCGRITMNMC